MFENHSIRRFTWERTTIPFRINKEQKANQNIKNDQFNTKPNDLLAENKLLREEIAKLEKKNKDLRIENKDLKQRLKDINKQKLINPIDYKRSSSVPKFSLSSKIKNNLGTNIGQNKKPLIMKQENIK